MREVSKADSNSSSDLSSLEGEVEQATVSAGEDAFDELESVYVDSDEQVEASSSGLANVFSKILARQLPDDDAPILAKAKKRRKVDDDDGVGGGGDAAVGEVEEDRRPKMSGRQRMLLRKERENLCRRKPVPLCDKERERNLVRLGTRGVVQLFNAVREHQSSVESAVKQVGSSERRKEKVLKKMTKKADFLDRLTKKQPTQKDSRKEESMAKWQALQDNFLTNQGLKEWDKNE